MMLRRGFLKLLAVLPFVKRVVPKEWFPPVDGGALLTEYSYIATVYELYDQPIAEGSLSSNPPSAYGSWRPTLKMSSDS